MKMNTEEMDLSNIINNKIKTEFEPYLAVDDQPPPFYSSDGNANEKPLMNNGPNSGLSNDLESKLQHKLNTELSSPCTLYSDLYNSTHNQSMINQAKYSTGNDMHCLNNAQFYQENADLSSNQQSIMMNNISLLGTLSNLPFDTLDHTNQTKSQQQQLYQANVQLANSLDQQINEIYQYAASDQMSKSTSIESDAAYSTLKLLDTASCNSSLVGGMNGLHNDNLIKCYPSNYTTGNAIRIESETDSGYTLSGSQKQQLMSIENEYVQELKKQLNHSSPINQFNQQLKSPVDCLYPANFAHSRTAILSHDTLDRSTQNCLNNLNSLNNLNKSVSTYSFVNLRSNDDLIHPPFSTHNSYLAYQSPSNITVLSSTPIPSDSSTKEALIGQQFSPLNQSANLVIMTNCPDIGQQSSLSSISNSGRVQEDSVWYKFLSRRLRERYISKRKIQDSSFVGKKDKLDLDSLDRLSDKKTITTNVHKSSFNMFYQMFLLKRCSLVPCLLIFACALLIFCIGFFTVLTYYFKNAQQILPLDDHLLLTNSHTQSHIKTSFSNNNLPQQPPTSQPPKFPLFETFNRILVGLTSIVRGVASSSSSSLPNSLTTGAESTVNKHTTQTESQIKFKQHQTNQWFRSAIIYEVFVASFQDSDEDGIGDLNGLINRLAYIKELGVTAIRLNSIFSALDYPYQFENILNHTQIEKKLGDINDFRRLIANCHNMGLRIVLDLNPSVTSDQHRWAAHFLNYNNKTNDSHNYYVNTSDYVPVNEAFFQPSFPTVRDQADDANNLNSAFEDVHLNIGGHLFLNYSHPFIRNQLIRTIRFWLNEGVDGFYLTRLHEIQFNQENPEHLIQLFSALKQQLNLYTNKATLNLDLNLVLDEDQEFLEPNPDQPAKILIASRESLDHLHKRLKRTLVDFWTQETRLNDAPKFHNLYPITMNRPVNSTKSNQLNQFDRMTIANLSNDFSRSADLNKGKLTLNQFINRYFQSKQRRIMNLKSSSVKAARNYFNIYSYFDLVDTFLDLRLNGSEKIRDQINELYLVNTIDDELFKDSTSISSSIVLWSLGDHTRPRLANRLHLNSVLVAQFILSMLPGSISLFYGDEIGLRNVRNINTVKQFKNGQLVPMAWSSRGLYANFTTSTNSNDEFISNKVVDLEESARSTLVNSPNAPWLPVSIDQLVHRNTEKLQEQIQRVQHLLQFRKQYLSIMNWNFHLYETITHHHQPGTSQLKNSFHNNQDSNQVKSVHQTYMFHYVNNGEIVFERYYHNGKTKRRYVLFANLSNVTRMNDFSDKFYFGTIKVASNVKRLRDFLYLNSLQLESGEALIALIE